MLKPKDLLGSSRRQCQGRTEWATKRSGWDDSTARDATACHLTLGSFDSSSTVDRDNSSQLEGVNLVATIFTLLLNGNDAGGRLIVSLNSFKDGFCHLWVAFVNHLDGVCPAGPMCDVAQPRRLNPRHPGACGKDVAALKLEDGASGATPAMVQKQRPNLFIVPLREPQSIQDAQF